MQGAHYAGLWPTKLTLLGKITRIVGTSIDNNTKANPTLLCILYIHSANMHISTPIKETYITSHKNLVKVPRGR